MDGKTLVLGVVLILVVGGMGVLVIGGMVAGMYNGLVAKDVDAANKWGKVQSAYQKRADLIPNLVETVRGAKNFEQETQTKIAEMRSQAGQAKIDMSNAQDAEAIQAANTQLSSVLSRLMVVVEAYPDLKANANFLKLQDELASLESEIKWERDNYNDAVKTYQTGARTFPTMFIANMFGFSAEKWKMFAADKGAQDAPKVSFGNSTI
jgi:LemA protein